MYPQYDQLDKALARVGAETDVAEVHGIVCGLYCATGTIEDSIWLPYVCEEYDLGDETDEELEHLLAHLRAESMRQIDDNDYTFYPLLPADSEPMAVRGPALSHWCQGLLFGLGLGGIGDSDKLPENCGEFLADLGKMSHVEVGTDDEEKEEAAFAELIEYLRVGLLLIRDELQDTGLKEPSR